MCWLLGAAAAAGADPSKRRLPAPCYWRVTATAAAAVPTKTRPSRTGKHHGPEGRTGSKICVSRGRNVPSKISYRKSLLYVSRCRLLGAAAAADPSKRRLPARKPHATEGRQRLLLLCQQRHGPPGRGNTMALKDEQSPKYACPGAGTSLLKSPTKSLLYVSGCWLAASCFTAAVALTAAFACVCCCLLMPAAACCCLLLPAAACCLLLPAASCCCLLLVLLLVAAAAAVVLLLCCCNQTASKARNSYCCCCCCAHKDTALLDGETPWP